VIEDIISKKVFCATKAHCYAIEFQKSSLAHDPLYSGLRLSQIRLHLVTMFVLQCAMTQPQLFQPYNLHMMHGQFRELNPSWLVSKTVD
jgi:hypothetical protein